MPDLKVWIHFQGVWVVVGIALIELFTSYLEKGLKSKKKAFAPTGSKCFLFFLFEPFLEGILFSKRTNRKTKSLSPLTKMANNLPK